jgi:hypothetical protein
MSQGRAHFDADHAELVDVFPWLVVLALESASAPRTPG